MYGEVAVRNGTREREPSVNILQCTVACEKQLTYFLSPYDRSSRRQKSARWFWANFAIDQAFPVLKVNTNESRIDFGFEEDASRQRRSSHQTRGRSAVYIVYDLALTRRASQGTLSGAAVGSRAGHQQKRSRKSWTACCSSCFCVGLETIVQSRLVRVRSLASFDARCTLYACEQSRTRLRPGQLDGGAAND